MVFKYFGGVRTPLGSESEMFRNRLTGATSVVRRGTSAAASLCTGFATPQEHASRLGALRGQAPELWRNVIDEAIQGDLLMSADDIHRRVVARLQTSSERPRITHIAVPTRDRPDALDRLLTSLSGHLRSFGRQAEVVVMDDSKSELMQNANQKTIAAFSGDSSLNISYGNIPSRCRFAGILTERAAQSDDSATFALLGDPEYPVSVGACRNALLLETLGKCFLFMDDDVQCRVAKLPNATDSPLFTKDAFTGSFLLRREDVDGCEFVSEDILAAHEKTLSIDAALIRSLAPNELGDFSAVSRRFLKSSSETHGAVIIAMMGLVGDAGIDDPLPYFVQGPATLHELARTEELFQAALTNRTITRGSRGLLLTDDMECMSYCMSVRPTSMLPPFSPVQRAEELVFGAQLGRCLPGSLVAIIPRAVVHQPLPPREFEPRAALRRAGRFSTGEILSALIRSLPVLGSSAEALFSSLGIVLSQLAEAEDIEFAEHVRQAVEPMLINQIQQLQLALEDASAKTALWFSDVSQIQAACLASLQGRNLSVPIDLERLWGEEAAMRQFKNLVGRFAQLVLSWPKILEATKDLHASGVRICH
jgi:hypothetical protein